MPVVQVPEVADPSVVSDLEAVEVVLPVATVLSLVVVDQLGQVAGHHPTIVPGLVTDMDHLAVHHPGMVEATMTISTCMEGGVQLQLLVILTVLLLMSVVVTNPLTETVMAMIVIVDPCHHWEDHLTIEDHLHQLTIPHPELAQTTAGELHPLVQWEIATDDSNVTYMNQFHLTLMAQDGKFNKIL